MAQPVSFMSDFGLDDEFVGVVHGVIAKLSPDSAVIDLTHAIPPGAVRAGALALTRSIQYLPEGVLLAVVDPGVGTSRRALAVETAWGVFVGPDNGLLSPAVAMMGGGTRIVSIENPDMVIPHPGDTFHGRDVFAPAAAVLAAGEAGVADLGPDIDPNGVMPLMLPLCEVADGHIAGECWWVDRYGNCELNIGPDDMAQAGMRPGRPISVHVGASAYEARWLGVYGEVDEGDLLLHVDSAGLMALAVRSGRADEELNLADGTPVRLSPS
jgi:S-adenosyl-L-methionine hydrolase (adenosine-forming)